MSSRIFFSNILIRVGLIICTSFVFIWFAESAKVEFVFILLTGILLITLQVYLLTRYVLGISRVIEQFIDAVGREETPEIQFGTGKALFRRLKERSNAIKASMNARRLEKEKDEQILIHVIDSADQGLYCFNSRGDSVFANEAALALVPCQTLTHLDEIEPLNRQLWEVLTRQLPGSPRVLRLYPGNREAGAIGGEQLLSVRLKEVKIFEETYRLFTLQNIQEELHKNESDSWQKIIRVLTHEIMNAVAPMLSLSKSLQTRIKSEKDGTLEKVGEGLRMIEQTGKGLMEFTEEYRRLSLLPSPKKETLRLSETLSGIRLLLENEAGESGIGVSLEVEGPQVDILADPQQFEMIMINLLKNAFDAFPPSQPAKQVIIRTQNRANQALVQVEDNGSGIPPELIDQVFVPFFSTKEQGSGIGLSLARQVMNNHQGSIYLESKEGGPTIVTLVFPQTGNIQA
jgi:two-component system nitrogen regulation sensor histidine kinase NtrY